MKMRKRPSHRKKIIVLSLLAVLIGSGAVYGYMASQPNSNDSLHQSDSKPDDGTTPDTSEDPKPSEDPDNTPSGTPNEEAPNYIDTPISEPTTNEPYPIENEHYKIQQLSSSSYKITLYPIANNPEYSDYNAQLRAYKKEALNYLKKRYGSTSQLTIEWSPKNAEDV